MHFPTNITTRHTYVHVKFIQDQGAGGVSDVNHMYN